MEPKAVLTAAKRACFDDILKPAGFIKGKKMFVRPDDPPSGRLIHGIDVQFHRGAYTINIGVHFDGVPGFFEFTERPPQELAYLDFALQARSYQFRPDMEQWIPLGVDPEAVKHEVAANLGRTLDVLADFTVRWPDAESFFATIPPAIFSQQTPNPNPCPGEPDNELIPALWTALPGWYPEGFEIAVALCILAMQEGRPELSAEYSAVALKQESDPINRKAFRKLWKTLSAGM